MTTKRVSGPLEWIQIGIHTSHIQVQSRNPDLTLFSCPDAKFYLGDKETRLLDIIPIYHQSNRFQVWVDVEVDEDWPNTAVTVRFIDNMTVQESK